MVKITNIKAYYYITIITKSPTTCSGVINKNVINAWDYFPISYRQICNPTPRCRISLFCHSLRCYFTRKKCYLHKKYGHIRHQRLNLNTKQCFVFCFTQILILTVNSAIFLWSSRPYWIEEINGKRSFAILNNVMSWKNIICRFEEIFHELQSVRVPQKKY